MYNITNLIVHVVGILLVVYACIPDHSYKANDLTLQKIVGVFALSMMGIWALVVGLIENFKSIISFVW